MENLVEINNTTLGIKEYEGQRVITFKDIDMVHERPEGTARKAFNRNRKRLIENEDYFIVKPEDLENTVDNQMSVKRTIGILQVSPRGTTFVTESGYLMIVKVFEDDLAWQVQRQLVNTYFRAKETSQEHEELAEKLIDALTSINDRLTKLEESSQKRKLPEKTYSRWKTDTFRKLNALLSYVNGNSPEKLRLSEIIHLVIEETEDNYSVEINDYIAAYKSEFCLDENPYVIDVISHYKDIRGMFTLTLDAIMEQLHIQETPSVKKNIFDILATQQNNCRKNIANGE